MEKRGNDNLWIEALGSRWKHGWGARETLYLDGVAFHSGWVSDRRPSVAPVCPDQHIAPNSYSAPGPDLGLITRPLCHADAGAHLNLHPHVHTYLHPITIPHSDPDSLERSPGNWPLDRRAGD